ncbi:hypothetical protein [Myroides odoratimimus]|uniref:hypothetical protein n=1 Tax=Myroides odoratimimus TaxID=76832 RepID=UPI00310182C2
MKKYLFLLLIMTSSFAQNTSEVEVIRYSYKTSIANGSKKLVRDGNAILDIKDKESRFTDLMNYSFITSQKTDNPEKNNQSTFKWTVYADGTTTSFYDKIGLDLSYYEEDKNSIKWTILPEVKDWNNYKVQLMVVENGQCYSPKIYLYRVALINSLIYQAS